MDTSRRKFFLWNKRVISTRSDMQMFAYILYVWRWSMYVCLYDESWMLIKISWSVTNFYCVVLCNLHNASYAYIRIQFYIMQLKVTCRGKWLNHSQGDHHWQITCTSMGWDLTEGLIVSSRNLSTRRVAGMVSRAWNHISSSCVQLVDYVMCYLKIGRSISKIWSGHKILHVCV